MTDITNSYVNAVLGLVCLALQLLARLKCAEVVSLKEKKDLDGKRVTVLTEEGGSNRRLEKIPQ